MKVRFKTEKEQEPDRDNGVQVKYGLAKRALPKLRWYLILLVVSSPLIYFVGKLVYSSFVVEAPGVISLSNVKINSTISGVVESISVEPLQQVEKGQQLIAIYKPEIKAEINRIQGDISDLQSMSIGEKVAPKKVREQINKQLDSARRMVEFRKERHKTVKYLFEQGAATSAELATALAQYDQASSYYLSLKKDLAIEEAQTIDPKYEYEKEKRIRSLQRELEFLEATAKELVQEAQFSGKILEIYVTQGQVVAIGAPLLSYTDGKLVSINAYLSPKYSEYAKVGQVANVKLPNGYEFKAVVRETPKLTTKVPSNFTSPLGARPSGILVKLEPLVEFGDDYRVQGLPVNISFTPIWMQ